MNDEKKRWEKKENKKRKERRKTFREEGRKKRLEWMEQEPWGPLQCHRGSFAVSFST